MQRDARTDDAQGQFPVQMIGTAPQGLPPVASKHLLAAWDLASDGARAGSGNPIRAFGFSPGAGQPTALMLADRDAACWAGAIGREMNFGTSYGLSICMRLLALVHLLGRQEWAARLALLPGQGIRLDPALLRAAAEAGLTEDAQFDEQDLLSRLQTRAASGVQPGA
jgi:hypothetical protein